MKKYIIITALAILLVSCSWPTDAEYAEQKKMCDINNEELYVYTWGFGSPLLGCKKKEEKVMDCIRKYNESIENKYNNPDTVSDLREDNFSNAVKTCNEVFGKK